MRKSFHLKDIKRHLKYFEDMEKIMADYDKAIKEYLATHELKIGRAHV